MFDGFETGKRTIGDVSINFVHGGDGPPLLLLHGFPQTHAIWHAIAQRLSRSFHIVCADLRGYGDNSKPESTADHATYSKRAMAADMVQLMASLGYSEFATAGHDRGGRVVHRLALDHPNAVTRAAVLDIAPTLHMFEATDQALATAYYHWFFLIQPDGLPERMIGADPAYYLREKIKRWSDPEARFDEAALAEYIRCYSNPACIHATCEDYRAGASIDLEHDRTDRAAGRKVDCPLLALWGTRGLVGRNYDMLKVWRRYARDVSGRALDCGHFLPEERPQDVADDLERFFKITA